MAVSVRGAFEPTRLAMAAAAAVDPWIETAVSGCGALELMRLPTAAAVDPSTVTAVSVRDALELDESGDGGGSGSVNGDGCLWL